MKKKYLECGRVCTAHGVNGLLKVESWCDSPRVLAKQKRVFFFSESGEYREARILSASVSGTFILMSVEGIENREDAFGLRGEVLYLDRDDIPLGKGDVFLQDMIGLPVIDADTDRVYGTVKSVDDGVRNRLYTVETENGDVIYPAAPGFIKEVDVDRGIFICPIPGFFD